jgi:hypothetical protein
MKIMGLRIALVAGAVVSALLSSAVQAQVMEISSNPSPAEKKDYLASLFRTWSYLKGGDTACQPALEEIEKGNVTFLAADAFGETEKPQAMRDLEKQCPDLNLGLHWVDTGSDPSAGSLDFVEPVTEKDRTALYGKPYRATRDFSLFNVPSGGAVRRVFVADKVCRDASCSGLGDVELIDPKTCLKETVSVGARYAGPKAAFIPGRMNGVAKIGRDYFFLQARRDGQSEIAIVLIPGDVKPHRHNRETVRCSLSAK